MNTKRKSQIEKRRELGLRLRTPQASQPKAVCLLCGVELQPHEANKCMVCIEKKGLSLW